MLKVDMKNALPSSTSIGFQAFLFVLTLVNFVKEAKGDWGRTPLAAIIVRDGTWAFLLFLCK